MAITTKSPKFLTVLGAALIALSPGAFAQGDVKVSDVKISIDTQKTPRYATNGPKEKRDTQKFWLEVEVEFTGDQKGGDPKEEFIDELEFKYFITIKTSDPKDRRVYTLTVNHVNIPKAEASASVAYMSPTTLARILGKTKVVNKSDIAVAVEISHKGKLVGGDATRDPRSKWWREMAQAEGMVLDKTQTPFAPLWYDRYSEVKPR